MIWLNKERAILLGGSVVSGIVLIFYIILIHSVWDFSTLTTYTGLPLAADFSNYWSAAKLALSGRADLIYNIDMVFDIQQGFLGTTHSYGCGWYYPPIFLLIVLPLGLMPYLLSFSVWIGITFLLFMLVLYQIKHSHICFVFMLVFPGMFESILFGQNGFLSGIFLGGGLLLLSQFPFFAGMLFGLLSYKPNLLPLIFLILITGRYWKTLLGTIISCTVVISFTFIIFGYNLWLDYFHIMTVPMKLLEMGFAPWIIMPTFFAAALSAGFNLKTAFWVQSAVMLLVVIGVGWAWLSKSNLALRGSILTLGMLLFTPYAFIYDLAILALPLCWLWEEGRVHGRLPGELIILFLGWVMPFAAPIFWDKINIFQGKLQIGPVILLALFIFSLIKLKFANLKELNGIQ